MSIEIVYDRAFLKTTTGIIPLVLTGSSNCTEWHYTKSGIFRERRERYWSYFWGDETLNLPVEELLDFIAAKCNHPDERELFQLRSRNKWITSKNCVDWYRSGIQSASTIENVLLYNQGLTFRVYLHVYNENAPDTTELEQYIRTTAQLEAWLTAAKARKLDLIKSGAKSVYLCLKFNDNEPLYKANFPEGPVIVKLKGTSGNYLIGYTSVEGFIFGPDASVALVFSSAEEALSKLGPIRNVTLLKANSGNQKPPRYALQFQSGRFNGTYVYNANGGRLKATPYRQSAKLFQQKHQAHRCALRIYERFSSYNGALAIIDLADGSIEPVPTASDR